MTRGGTYLGTAGAVLTRARLERYRRYGLLLEAQEEALDGGDLERFRWLADEAERLRSETDPVDDSGELSSAEKAEARAVLEAALERGVRIRERLREMRAAAASDVRDIRRRGPQARRYVRGEGTPPAGPSKLDVRS